MKKIILAMIMVTLSAQSSASLLGNKKEDKKGNYHITCWHRDGTEYLSRYIDDFFSYNSYAWKIINLDGTRDYLNSECYIEEVK